jgi:uracil-DNA glycosylase
MFAGLSTATKELLVVNRKQEIGDAIKKVNSISSRDMITPAPELIFSAFRLCPAENIRVVIIGQDPYTNGTAQGMSFSVPSGVTIPPSLVNIYRALLGSNLITTMPTHGNLESWATQGVLLLNSALTTQKGLSQCHQSAWAPYTSSLIKEISKKYKPIFMLFGLEAQKNISIISDSIILKWCHPSPQSNMKDTPTHFKYCTTFSQANEKLKQCGDIPINWNSVNECAVTSVTVESSLLSSTTIISATIASSIPTVLALTTPPTSIASSTPTALAYTTPTPVSSTPTAPTTPSTTPTLASIPAKMTPAIAQLPDGLTPGIYVFTDGAARANGKENCVASWAFYMTDGRTDISAAGIVPPVVIEGKKYTSSNNRGELLGIAMAIKYILFNITRPPNVTIVTDSEYSLNSITKYINDWRKDEKKMKGKQNLDLICATRDDLDVLEKKCKVNFRSINSHTSPPSNDKPIELFYWTGNDRADKLCTGVL